jgi:hypothetical protein
MERYVDGRARKKYETAEREGGVLTIEAGNRRESAGRLTWRRHRVASLPSSRGLAGASARCCILACCDRRWRAWIASCS